MRSNMKALILAAIVASVAVLAVLPAEDSSAADADPVVYLGYDDEGTHLDVTVNEATSYAIIMITQGTQSYLATFGDMATYQTYFHNVIVSGVNLSGDWTYSVENTRGTTVYATGTLSISEQKAYSGTTDTYSVTFTYNPADGSLGTVTTDSTTTSLETGDKVVLQIAATDGNELTALTANGEDVLAQFDKENGTYTVTIEDEDVAVEATFAAKTTPVDPTPHAITVTVTGIEGVAVDAQVEGAVVKEAVQGKTVKLVPGTYDSDKYSVAYTVNGEAVTGDSFTMPDEDVVVVAAFTEKTTVPDGISIDGKNYPSVSEAIEAAQSGQTVEVATDVTEDITLSEGVSVEIAEKGSYIGTITYDDTKVKIISLGAGSEITISAGSVHISGTFAKSSEISVPAGQFVLDDVTVSENAKVVIDLDAGTELTIGNVAVGKSAILEIKGEGTVLLPDSEKLKFDATSIYRGPAFTEDGSTSGKLVSFAYPEDSRITYDERTYMVHLFTGGSYTFAVGLQYYETTYSGNVIELEDLLGQNWTTKVFYVNQGDIESFVSTTEGNTTTENSITKVRVDDETVPEIRDPGIYDYAYRIRTTVEDTSGNTLTSYRYVDFGVIVGYLDIDDLEITAKNEVYDGNEKTAQLTASDATAELEIIGYTDLQGNTVKPIEAGDYYVIVRVGGFYDAVVSDVEFTIEKAPTELALTDNTNGAGWHSEQYENGNVTYTVDPSVYVDDEGAVLNVELVATVEGQQPVTVTGTIATQADLDRLIKDAFTGPQYDSGYTLVITLTNVESKNYKAADPASTDATVTLTIGNFPPTKIYATFGAGSDNVKVAQDGEDDYTVEITSTGKGLSKDASGNYVFTITVDPSVSIVLKTAAADELGRVLMSEPVVYTYDDDSNIAEITFTLSSLPAQTSEYTFQIIGDSRYTTSEVYTLDISGVFSDDLKLYLVEAGYPVAAYEANQYYDLAGETVLIQDGEKFYLPATAAKENGSWTLQLSDLSDAGKKDYYSEKALYIIDVKDRVSYDLPEGMTYNGQTSVYGIVFVATAGSSVDPTPVDPTEKQSISIVGAGYYEKGADANAAIEAYGFKDIDSADKTMFVVFTNTVAGDVTVTLRIGDQTYSISKYEQTPMDAYSLTSAGTRVIYWTFDPENTGTSVPATYASGDVATITVADASAGASASITVGWSGGQTVEPVADYSTAIRAALDVVRENNAVTGVNLMLVATDDGNVAAGTITVSYTYTSYRNIAGTMVRGSASGSFEQSYSPTTDKAYAYIAIDFTADATALSHYADITGASAGYKASNNATAGTSAVAFTLPSRS